MERVVYVDLYFFINFAMDFLCFYLVTGLLSLPRSLKRVLLASSFGALYACFALILGASGLLSVFLDLLACFLMCAIAYYRRSHAKELFTNALVYSAVSILLGGAMSALFYLFNRIGLDRMLGSEEDADDISVWIFALLAIFGGAITVFGGKFFKKRASRRFCRIKIILDSKSVWVDAICDSGNLLREPISSLPCIIIDRSVVVSLFGNSIENASYVPENLRHRLRVVPMQTLGGSNIAYAFRADRILIDLSKEQKEVAAFIVISPTAIRAGGARALVPAELL